MQDSSNKDKYIYILILTVRGILQSCSDILHEMCMERQCSGFGQPVQLNNNIDIIILLKFIISFRIN